MDGFTLLCLAAFLPTTSADYWYGRELDARVTLKIVKHDAFRDVIKKHHGKPAIVYCWANYSIVDMHLFPRFQKLNDRYEGRIVAISLSVDDKEKQASVLRFLRRTCSDAENYLLDEDEPLGELKTVAPAIIIYDATGKRVATYNCQDETDFFEATEKHLKRLLTEPGK